MKSFVATLALVVSSSAFAGLPSQCQGVQDALNAKAGISEFRAYTVETDSGDRQITTPDEAIEMWTAACEQAKKPNARLGMSATAVMQKTKWGKPDSINRTTTKYGTHEQWVYGNSYLYFDNGILTAAQN